MKKLSELPNIGKVMEKRLENAGICDSETLKRIGSKEAFIRLHQVEGDPCLSSLCGLEGAIQGIRWHLLSQDVREDLKNFYQQFYKNK